MTKNPHAVALGRKGGIKGGAKGGKATAEARLFDCPMDDG